jgi:D-beta-D-heptose 7-phosphate kinase/D-beta-D-heptose 1-phosphate adenosyltransferase
MILWNVSYKKVSALSGEFFIEIYSELFKIQPPTKFSYADIHVLPINKSIIIFRFLHAGSIAWEVSRKDKEKHKKLLNLVLLSEAMEANKKRIIVAVSGGFDPLHIGHVRLFERARALGDELVVILNNDNWLTKKKGYAFMAEQERKEVIESLRAVNRVVITTHEPEPEDMSVAQALRDLRPDIFANGGDRNEANAADPTSSLYKDIAVCKELGIEMIFNIGEGGKVQSSSWLIEKERERTKKNSAAVEEKKKD